MLNSIQILRALAAWLVVGHHIIQLYYKSSTSGIASEILHKYGAIGVDLFFIISGFVIYASASKKLTSPADFAKNRLIRIVPAYWVFTLITAAILIYAPNSIPLTSLEPIFLIKSLFFIPAQNPSGIGLYPLMTVGWTLNYEISFYAVFFISLFLPQKMRIASLFAGVALIQFAASKAGEPFSFYKNAIVWEFLLGVAIQIAYQRGLIFRITPALAVSAVLLAICTIAYAGPVSHDPYKSGLPCAVILCAAVSQERFFPKHNFLVKLGDWSYSTYLSHVLVICLAIYISEQFQVNDYVLMLCVCALTLGISMVSFSIIEKPLCGAFKRYQISRTTIKEAV
ncbi:MULTISPECIES: acyltransferase family protein [Pseudomonas]|uniref:acyltransferase family protein n=1 Tax=Pseudomonas TaxID=286 RepID=UPI0015970943|nr:MULTISPECIES: acyltransferase [Pseudomonas]